MLALVLLALFGLSFWAYRSRLKFALKAATIGYLAVIAINIARLSGDEQSLGTVAVVLLGSLLLWGAGWLVVSFLAKRRPDSKTH